MTDLRRLAYAFFEDGVECGECDTPFAKPRIRFTSAPEEVDCDLLSEYECISCGVEYDILVDDQDDRLLVLWERRNKHWYDSRYTSKSWLYEYAHPMRSLVEDLRTLDSFTDILHVSKYRIEDHTDIRKQAVSRKVNALIFADVHNYLATAYSLQQCLESLGDEVPVEAAKRQKDEYDKQKRVIIGLRTYVQHYRHFPITHDFDDMTSPHGIFRVDLSEVAKVGDEPYYEGFDHHYGHVDGDSVNLNECIRKHFEATKAYVNAIEQYCEEEYEDELKDYRERTSRNVTSSIGQ